MAFKNIPRGDDPFAYESLGKWAKDLGIPVRSLLHHSANGHFPVFALPPRDVDYYLIHEDFLYSPAPAPIPTPMLSAHGAMGLILNKADLSWLAAGKHVEVSAFYALIRKNAGWTEITPPVPNPSGEPDRNDCWQVVAYHRTPDVHGPLKLKIEPTRLYVRNMDIEAFAQSLRSGQFVNDLIVDGKIVEALPPYVSHKLREMIDANRLFWRNYLDDGIAAKERRRAGMQEYLKEDFRALCDKKTSPDSLLSFAILACDPSTVPATQPLGTSSLTPHLRALLTAAKLFWSPHCSYEASHATYPAREPMEDFIRFMGVRAQNAPIAATTVIRPEDVKTPEQPENPAARLLRPRQALPR